MGTVGVVVTDNDGPAHVVMNDTHTANHWIGFRLVGHRSNRDGMGTVIHITTSEGT